MVPGEVVPVVDDVIQVHATFSALVVQVDHTPVLQHCPRLKFQPA